MWRSEPRPLALALALLTLALVRRSSQLERHQNDASSCRDAPSLTEDDTSLFQTLAKVTARVAIGFHGHGELEAWGNSSAKPGGPFAKEQTSLFQTQVSVDGDADIAVASGAPKLQWGRHRGRDIGLDDDPEISPLRYEIEERKGQLNKFTHQGRWVGWVRPGLRDGNTTVGDEMASDFFHSAPPGQWIALGSACVVLCILDGMVLKRAPDTFRWHLAIIFIWMVLAFFYLVGVWLHLGHARGVEWVSGYVLEWMLSLDNLFIFHLVFKTYQTPKDQIPKAVFIGIIGAVVMRLVFFLIVSTLLQTFGWFRWPFGLLLVWSGIEAVKGEDDEGDVKETRLVQLLRFCFGSRVLDGYDPQGPSIFVFDPKTGKLQLSLLFIVIILVEFSDIIFALDSVSAKVAQIPNQYIAFSSSVLAMYGLRAMFFIIEDLVDKFDLLKYGLGFILVFIGVELMVGHWFHVPSGAECLIIVAVFVVCIVASSVRNCLWPDKEAKNPALEGADSEEPSPEPAPTPANEGKA
mmetsp:Transcript_57191/g.133338  ORF Transcript_57191/g.133338 Transcript_57191/m.133338 type:complete len:520 (+) Transcript_57191:89-1648(+)